MFLHRTILHIMETETGGDLTPLSVGLQSKYLRGLDGILERDFCRTVSKGIVVYVRSIFVGSDHILDRVTAVFLSGRTRNPEIGNRLHHPIPLVPQPFLVFGNPIIIPERNPDVRRDMMFESTGEAPRRRSLLAAVIALPGKHRPAVTEHFGTLQSLPQPVGTIIDMSSCQILVQHQHRRIHPQLRIPEYMTVVTRRRRQSHGRDTQPRTLPLESIQVIQGQPHVPLVFLTPLYHNIPLPHFSPGLFMSRYQVPDALSQGKDHHALRPPLRIGKVAGSTSRSDQ